METYPFSKNSMIQSGADEEVTDADDTLGPIFRDKLPLISSYGTAPGLLDAKLWLLHPLDLLHDISSLWDYDTDHKACDSRTADTPEVTDNGDILGSIYHDKVSLISSYGVIPGNHRTRNLVDLSKAGSSALKYEPDHEACNFLTSNTRPVFGGELNIDLPLYEYSALPPTGWIRLLWFRIPATRAIGTVHCEIRQAPLDVAKTLPYKALSYAWGHPYRTHHIICDDARIPITANLADWFRHCQPGIHLFWIDAICINQTDKLERAAQVERMRDVYRNAEKVVAWLGSILPPHGDGCATASSVLPHSEDTVQALHTITAFAGFQSDLNLYRIGLSNSLLDAWNNPGRFKVCCQLIWTHLRIREENLRGLLLMVYHSIVPPLESPYRRTMHTLLLYTWHYTARRHMRDLEYRPMLTFLRLPYFSRRWIIQELRSARSDDHIAYQWDTFLVNPIPMSFIFASNMVVGEAQDMESLDCFVEISRGQNQANSIESRTPAIDLLLLATRVHVFECLDPRDRVFCLTGLYPQLDFRVDYTRPAEELYLSFASHLVTKEPGCLPTLLICAIRHPFTSASWPSWVPDWRDRIASDSPSDTVDVLSAGPPHLPSECLEFNQVSPSDPGVLKTCGLYVGFIAGREVLSDQVEGVATYLVITPPGNVAWIIVSPCYHLLAGDLIFDIGRLFIVRSNDSHQVRLIGTTLYRGLFWLRGSVTGSEALRGKLLDILDRKDGEVHDEPQSFAGICNKTSKELLRLSDAFTDINHLIDFIDLHDSSFEKAIDTKWQQFRYNDSVEFPRSQCLTFFDII